MMLFSFHHAVIFLSHKEFVGYQGQEVPPHLHGKQGYDIEQCRRTLKGT